MKQPDHPQETRHAESADEDRMRAIFQRQVPDSPPLEIDKLLRAARQPSIPGRSARSKWVLSAAAVLLVSLGAGIGWTISEERKSREVEAIQSSLASELQGFRSRIVLELARTIADNNHEILALQTGGIKDVARLLRDDYQMQFAQLEKEIDGIALAVSFSGQASSRR